MGVIIFFWGNRGSAKQPNSHATIEWSLPTDQAGGPQQLLPGCYAADHIKPSCNSSIFARKLLIAPAISPKLK